jgi:hypothetical protein
MKRTVLGAAIAALASGNTYALGSLATVDIVDRDSGTSLTAHYYRGEYWVAGRPGAKYAIRILNNAGGRILAVTSVDGINVLSGEAASAGQEGYVFYPTQSYEITGWRKSKAEVAAFTFTAVPDSYAALTGRPANVGVIGVALFRERPPVVISPPALLDGSGWGPRAPMPAPSAAAAGSASRKSELSAQALGTGHGERESSPVEFTDFQRLQPEPNEVVRIRYDSMDNLVARGVLPRPGRHTGTPEPFPADSRGFVPDPPG